MTYYGLSKERDNPTMSDLAQQFCPNSHDAPISALCWDPDTGIRASADTSGQIAVTRRGETVPGLVFQPGGPIDRSLALLRGGGLLAVGDEHGSVGVYKTKGEKWLARVYLPKQCLEPPESTKCEETCHCKRKVKDLGHFRTALEAGRARIRFFQDQPWSPLYTGSLDGPVEEMPERMTDPTFHAWLGTLKRHWVEQRRARGIEPPSPTSPELGPKPKRGRPAKKLGGNGARKDRRWAHTKDPNAPKPPWNGYMFLTQELKPGMQAADPSLTLMDIGRVIGAKWRGMTPEEKQPYLDQSSADSIR